MTNFVISTPNIVFIHLPKTGGTSVRDAFGPSDERYFGHLPEEFRGLPKLAVIREPRQRFLSALRMFKYGNRLDGDYYAKARWPELTISKALDVLEDPWIGFDRSYRDLAWDLKHHLLPQTHPFNCLFYADDVLRFETLEADFADYCAKLGLSAQLPRLRVSQGGQEQEAVWTAEEEMRFKRLFEDDYRVLNYLPDFSPEHRRVYDLAALKPEADTVYDLWPAYFSGQKVFVENAADALPDERSTLEPFADEIIPGAPAGAWAKRSKDLVDHFHQIL